MDETQREVDEIRKERSEVENHIIDEYAAGRLSRRDFVRRGTVIGMSIPMVAFLAAACGGGGDESGGGGETTAPADTGGADTGAPAETRTAAPQAERSGSARRLRPARSTRSRFSIRAVSS